MAHKVNSPRNIDPTLLSFLNQSQVIDALEDANSKFVRVTFVKKGGDIASRVGRGKTYSRRVDPATASPESIARAQRASEALAANGNVWLDYPNPDARKDGRKGFSFNLGRVVAVGDVGEHVDE